MIHTAFVYTRLNVLNLMRTRRAYTTVHSTTPTPTATHCTHVSPALISVDAHRNHRTQVGNCRHRRKEGEYVPGPLVVRLGQDDERDQDATNRMAREVQQREESRKEREAAEKGDCLYRKARQDKGGGYTGFVHAIVYLRVGVVKLEGDNDVVSLRRSTGTSIRGSRCVRLSGPGVPSRR